MKKEKAFIETWGCQLNHHKSEGIAGNLAKKGYEITENLDQADLIVFNTCAVRERSEQKVRGRIGQIKEERKENSTLGVGGCMAQHKGDDLLDRLEGVDFVFGSSNLDEIPALAKKSKEEKCCSLAAPNGLGGPPYRHESDFSAWLTISRGCSNRCSYCIVPSVTGPLRSRRPEEVLAEAKKLIDDGYKEIELLGQNVNAYGRDREGLKKNFASLLEELASLEIPRISFTTPHPRDLEEETLAVMADSSNVSRHLHLPLQSGSNKVLKAMNRGYSREEYLDLVELARDYDPDVNITTDIIVGHPGEERKDFEKTLEVIEKVKYGSVYVAKFSPRPETKSNEMDDHVPLEEKKQRLKETLGRQKSVGREEDQKYLGKTVEVLVEGEARKDGHVFGKNEFKKTTVFPGDESFIGQFVSANLEEIKGGTLYGKKGGNK